MTESAVGTPATPEAGIPAEGTAEATPKRSPRYWTWLGAVGSVALLAIVMTVGVFIGRSGKPEEAPVAAAPAPAPVVEAKVAEPEPQKAPEPAPAPTRNEPFGAKGEGKDLSNPLPLGGETVLKIGEHEFTVSVERMQWDDAGEVRTDAGGGPAAGSRFVIVPVTVRYAGASEVNAWDNVRVNLAWTDANGSTFILDEPLDIYAPNDLYDQPVLLNGGAIKGNVPFEVPDNVAGPIMVTISLTDGEAEHLVFFGPAQP